MSTYVNNLASKLNQSRPKYNTYIMFQRHYKPHQQITRKHIIIVNLQLLSDTLNQYTAQPQSNGYCKVLYGIAVF